MLGKWLPPVWEMIVHLAVAGDVFDGVLFFPRDVLDKIWDWMETVPENFPSYSFRDISEHTVVLRQAADIQFWTFCC